MAKRGSTAEQSARETRAVPESRQDGLADKRTRLFEALGIIEVTRHALASKLTTLDEHSVIDALKAAYRIIDDVAGALERSESAPGDRPARP